MFKKFNVVDHSHHILNQINGMLMVVKRISIQELRTIVPQTFHKPVRLDEPVYFHRTCTRCLKIVKASKIPKSISIFSFTSL